MVMRGVKCECCNACHRMVVCVRVVWRVMGWTIGVVCSVAEWCVVAWYERGDVECGGLCGESGYCTLYINPTSHTILKCTVYKVHSYIYNEQRLMYSVHCTLYTSHCTSYTAYR